MTPELQVLAYAGLLQGVQYVLMSVSANLDLGPGKTMSARDVHRLGRPLAELLGVRAGRLYRAFTNHFEGLILFTLAVVVVTLSDRATGFSAGAAGDFSGLSSATKDAQQASRASRRAERMAFSGRTSGARRRRLRGRCGIR